MATLRVSIDMTAKRRRTAALHRTKGLQLLKAEAHLCVPSMCRSVFDAASKPIKVYEFPDGESRIDYPVWSPDGKWILFDRFRPQGGDIWEIENVAS